MEFKNVFATIGCTLQNHVAYKLLKEQFLAKGYTSKKARYAALGCLSGRSQGPTCIWYRDQKGLVFFKRVA